MRAVVMAGPGEQQVEDVTLLPPEADEVIVRVRAALPCVTDHIQRTDGGGLTEPHIRGHAGIGVVEAVGSDVRRVRPGARVLMPTRPQCGHCFWCDRGQAEQCVLTTRPGSPIALRSDGAPLPGSARVGSFAEATKVGQAQVVPVTTDLSDAELVLLGCGGGGGLGAALCVADIAAGSTVVVLGAGVFGLSALQGARICGAARIIVVEPIAERRELALRLGATDVLHPDDDVLERVRELTGGRGADTVLECVGAAAAVEQAFTLTRIGGDLVIGSFGAKSATVQFPLNDLALRGKRLLSCQYGGVNILRDLPRFIALMERGLFDATALLGRQFGLDEVDEALDLQGARTMLGAVIVP